MTDGTPIAYGALAKGTPVRTAQGHEIGTVEHVLQIPSEDLFDGIVVKTEHGLRFVDRDQVQTITDTAVTCDLTLAQADALPEPAAAETFHFEPGTAMYDYYGRMFQRGRWRADKS